MKGIFFPLVIFVIVITGVYIVGRYMRWFGGGRPYHKWIYVDIVNAEPTATDITGNPIAKPIVTHKNDQLIFVNRTGSDIQISFANNEIFGSASAAFPIAPDKRVVRTVKARPSTPNHDTGWTISLGTGGVTPPKVKVGEDP